MGYRTYAMGKLHFVPYAPPGEPRLVHGFEHVDLHESGRILARYDPQGQLNGAEDYFDYLKTVGWHGYTRAHGAGNNDVRPCPSPLPAEHHVDRWIADCTIAQIDHHSNAFPDRPFFMWMSSPKPHSPYDPPRPYDAMYDPRTIPAPFGSARRSEWPQPRPRLGGASATPCPTLSPEAWQVIRSYYYGCITFLDAMIGRVVAHLAQRGQLENTVILFTADHGDLIGDFGSCFKTNHLNGSVRVPFLAAGPGVTEGRVSQALVGLQDILPTFAAIAGAEIGQPVQGQDLSPHLANLDTPVRDVYYAATADRLGQSAMVTDGKWKAIYSEVNATHELYDQINDPQELHNLAHVPQYRLKAAQMDALLQACARQYGDSNLFAGEDLVSKAVKREDVPMALASGMGWRWY